MSLTTPLTKLLDIKSPIVSAAMAYAAGGALAAQVTLAGGFGFLAPGVGPVSAFEDELALARTMLACAPDAQLPVGAGFLGWLLDAPDGKWAQMLDAALAARVKAVWLSFGADLGKWVERVREHDRARGASVRTLVWVLVNSVAEAEHAVRELAADVLVVQGIEAGGHGHGNAPPLLTLLPLISRALPSPCPPLVAAGGLTHGGHIAAVLALGAAGAVLGTRFLATPESLYPPEKKAQILRAANTVRSVAYDEVRGSLGWPAGVDGRAVPNAVYEEYVAGVDVEERKRRHLESEARGEDTRSIVWAGASVALVDEIAGASDVVKSLHDEVVMHLSRAAAILS